MRYSALLLSCLITIISYSQTGTISGNAFWKYNEYVGTRPDAGSKVYLFTSDTSQSPKEARCDVQGYFKFDNLQPGKYLIIIQSSNTNEEGLTWLANMAKWPIKNYLGFDFSALDRSLYDSLPIYKNEYDYAKEKILNQELYKLTLPRKEYRAYKDSLPYFKILLDGSLDKYFKGLNSLSISLFMKYHKVYYLGTSAITPNKVYVKEIEVKSSETTSVVADFGITYM